MSLNKLYSAENPFISVPVLLLKTLVIRKELALTHQVTDHLQETWFVSFIGTFSILIILASSLVLFIKRKKSLAMAKHFNQYAGKPFLKGLSSEN